MNLRHIQMSGATFACSFEEVEQTPVVIPQFDFEAWARHQNEQSMRRNVQHTGNTLTDIVCLVSSNRYRRGPRCFFDSMGVHYKAIISAAIQNNRRLELVLPSFPVKCFNPLKVRRSQPDLAEIGCLSQLYSLCRDIERIYPPGAQMIFVTDGLVYAPIFREPIEYATRYRNEINRFIRELGYDEHMRMVDMKDLIIARQSEFDDLYPRVEQKIANHWRKFPATVERRMLIENTMTNINLTSYSECDLIEVFVHGQNLDLAQEIQERAIVSAFEYLVFNQTIREMYLVQNAFSAALRVTCHPKEGQLGLHMVHPRSFNFPWNGVGILRNDGTVRVEFEYEARRNQNYQAVYIAGDCHAFYFQSI